MTYLHMAAINLSFLWATKDGEAGLTSVGWRYSAGAYAEQQIRSRFSTVLL